MNSASSRRRSLIGVVGLLLACALGGAVLWYWHDQSQLRPALEQVLLAQGQSARVERMDAALVDLHLELERVQRGASAATDLDAGVVAVRTLQDMQKADSFTVPSAAVRQKLGRYLELARQITQAAATRAPSPASAEDAAFRSLRDDLRTQRGTLLIALQQSRAALDRAADSGSNLAALFLISLLLVGIASAVWIQAQIFRPMHRLEVAARASLRDHRVRKGQPAARDELNLALRALDRNPPTPAESTTPPTPPVPGSAMLVAAQHFEEDFAELVERCARLRQGAVLALARIRFFDRIVAAYGIEAGEQYAEAMVQRLSGLFAAPARVVRYQRNLLAVVKVGMAADETAAHADELARSIAHAFGAPVQRGIDSLWSEAHIALALYPKDEQSAQKLLRAAMALLNTIGSDEPSGTFFTDENAIGKARDRMRLAERIRAAINSNEFEPYFQPIVDLSTRKVKFVELLARWPGSNGLSASPSEFIQVAEDSDQAWQLSSLLFLKAAHSMKAWRATGLRLPICVNVSGNLITARLPQLVRQILEATDMPPEMLEVEITETAVFQNPEEALKVLRELGAMGVSLTLDDFGTGYSSLSYLLTLPISKVKIDQSFVRRVLIDPGAESIIRATINLAHSMGHGLVAEGIASQEISDRLFELGCPVQQGFLFSPGLPPPEALRWIRNWEAGPTVLRPTARERPTAH